MLSCIPNPTIKDWNNLIYLYGYVKSTINYGLHIYSNKIENIINISPDSLMCTPYAESALMLIMFQFYLHKSHTGYIIYYGNSPIHAKSIKQTNVCDSSSYAELVAMHASMHMMNHPRRLSVLLILHESVFFYLHLNYFSVLTVVPVLSQYRSENN